MKLIKLLFTLLFAACSILGKAQVTTKGLIGWYSFSGNANDRSGSGYHGSINGATLTDDRFGFSDNAYSFNGNGNYVLLGSTFDIMPRTISVWFMPHEIGAFANIFSIDNKDITKGAIGISSEKINGKHKIVYFACLARDTADLTANAWHNTVVVQDTGFVWFYLDNKLVGKHPYSQFYHSNDVTTNATVGTSRALTNRFFEGAIDDIRIYNRRLSDAELTALSRETGVHNVVANNSLSVYPNPCTGSFFMDLSALPTIEGYTVKVTNALGQEVYVNNIDDHVMSIDLGNTASGLYFVHVTDALGNEVGRRKLVVES